ncbi:MAG: hypothetical protein ACLSVD_03615 [Eggerthellaceae bacterium]
MARLPNHLLQSVVPSSGDVPLPGWTVPLSAYALTFLLLAALKWRGIVPQGRWYRIAFPRPCRSGWGCAGCSRSRL